MSEKEEIMSVDDSEDSKSSSSEDEDDQEEKTLISRAQELESQLSTNKFLYDFHVEIVDVYRKLGDLNSMRAAYERFHNCFPLTPKLWLVWIKDEIKIAQTPEEQKYILNLFDKAVEDYLSIDLWIEYAQYSIGVGDLATTRSILERGLMAGGLHTSQGSLLWDTLRELEHAHMSLNEEGSEEWKAQIVRLAEVFKRQLSVPLLGMDNTFEEWQEWSKTIPEGLFDKKSVEWAYNKAKNLLEVYKPYEERLLAAENDNHELLQIYKEYLKSVKDPSTVICLYERALLPLCLIPELWIEYCMSALKLGEIAIKISSRALRNCTWNEDLWIAKLRIIEHLGKPETDILTCFEEGLNSITPNPGLNLWLSYLEYLRRNGTETEKLYKTFTQALEQIGMENDPTSKINRFYARLLAKSGDIAAAHKIWNGILGNKYNKVSSSLWLEYANLERQYGDSNHLRSIFKRALSANIDWPQYITEEWLMFERESGTLEDVINCTEKIQSVIKDQPGQIANVVQPRENEQTVTEQRNRKRKFEHNDNKIVDNKRSKFSSYEERQTKAPQRRIEKDPKTTVFVSNLHNSATEEKLKELFPKADLIEIATDRKGKPRGYGYIQFRKEEEVLTALANDRIPLNGRPVFVSEIKPERTERKPAFKYATTSEKNKLFVRGLPETKTKEEISEIFESYNPKDVRVIMKKSGQSKGIAYIEFESEEAALNALKATDQMKVDDQVISVAISAPPPKKPQNISEREPIRHARSRLQVPLIPRSLQVKEKDVENGSKLKEGSKSNADFRSMLLKK